MDFNNVSELLEGMKSYCEAFDIRKLDLFSYDAFKLSKDPNPRLKALVDKDRYGEYLGLALKSWTDTNDSLNVNRITVYLRSDDRVAGVWNNIGGMLDCYEMFEYHDGYHTGGMYHFIGSTENCMRFTYYIEDDEGRVTEILSIYGGMVSYNSDNIIITRILLDYDSGVTVLKSSVDLRYIRGDYGYKFFDEEDNLEEKDFPDRVIDDQKDLCKTLKKRVRSCKTLEDIVETFFDVISEAEDNPEEEVSYTAGTYPFRYLPGMEGVIFNLMRWTPTEDDEYYQLQINVNFDIKDEEIPYDNMNDVGGVDSLREAILDSDSFNALKDKKIKKVKVELVET